MSRRSKSESVATRDAIIDAAERLFERHGVARTSLEAIARAAEVTRGAIYWHFRDKGDLLAAMQDRARLPQEQFFASRSPDLEERSLEALEEATIETIRRFTADERARRVYTIILFRCEYVGDLGSRLLKRCETDNRMRAAIVQRFREASDRGGLAAPWTPAVAADVYMTALVGLFSEFLRRGDEFDILATAAPMMRSLFAGFSASTPAAP